jgi:hypothetical protein
MKSSPNNAIMIGKALPIKKDKAYSFLVILPLKENGEVNIVVPLL